MKVLLLSLILLAGCATIDPEYDHAFETITNPDYTGYADFVFDERVDLVCARWYDDTIYANMGLTEDSKRLLTMAIYTHCFDHPPSMGGGPGPDINDIMPPFMPQRPVEIRLVK